MSKVFQCVFFRFSSEVFHICLYVSSFTEMDGKFRAFDVSLMCPPYLVSKLRMFVQHIGISLRLNFLFGGRGRFRKFVTGILIILSLILFYSLRLCVLLSSWAYKTNLMSPMSPLPLSLSIYLYIYSFIYIPVYLYIYPFLYVPVYLIFSLSNSNKHFLVLSLLIYSFWT